MGLSVHYCTLYETGIAGRDGLHWDFRSGLSRGFKRLLLSVCLVATSAPLNVSHAHTDRTIDSCIHTLVMAGSKSALCSGKLSADGLRLAPWLRLLPPRLRASWFRGRLLPLPAPHHTTIALTATHSPYLTSPPTIHPPIRVVTAPVCGTQASATRPQRVHLRYGFGAAVFRRPGACHKYRPYVAGGLPHPLRWVWGRQGLEKQ